MQIVAFIDELLEVHGQFLPVALDEGIVQVGKFDRVVVERAGLESAGKRDRIKQLGLSDGHRVVARPHDASGDREVVAAYGSRSQRDDRGLQVCRELLFRQFRRIFQVHSGEFQNPDQGKAGRSVGCDQDVRGEIRLVVHGDTEHVARVDFIRCGVHHVQGLQLLLDGIGVSFVPRDYGCHAGDGDPAEGSGVACGDDKGEDRQEEE